MENTIMLCTKANNRYCPKFIAQTINSWIPHNPALYQKLEMLCKLTFEFVYQRHPIFYSKARRPPVEETTSFLQSLLDGHGSNFLEVFFGPKARNNLKYLGGIQNVAIVLSGLTKF